MKFSISEIQSITGAVTYGAVDASAVISSYLFDSRSVATGDPAGSLFFALVTEAADGHAFIPSLYAAGVRVFVVDRLPERWKSMPDATFLKVGSVAAALDALAHEARGRLKGSVIGITGSAGKTVVKEMLYRTLADHGHSVSRSPRSWNSRIGVPMSLLEACPDDEYVIIEAGIDTVGNMASLASIIAPDLGILTSITDAHDLGFASREQKIREKAKLFAGASAIVYDDATPGVGKILADTCSGARLIPVSSTSAVATDRALVRSAIRVLGVKDVLLDESIEPASNRIDVHEGVNDCVMLHDAFTHDLRSLRWALDFMSRRATSTRTNTLILSDLYNPAPDDYRALAALLDRFGITRLSAIGPDLARNRDVFSPAVTVENLLSTQDFLRDYDINRFSSETILIAGEPLDGFRRIKAALESPRHDTIFEIDLDAVVHNYNYYRSLLRPDTGLIGMVKASAYGTGALEISKTLQSQGAAYLAVAVVDEGVELRRGGITMPIMVLNPVTTNYTALFRYRLEPSVFSLDELQKLAAEAAKAGVSDFKIHIKLDTGMHRVGFTEDELPTLISALKQNPSLHVASVFSHLATADCPDQEEYTGMQLDTFRRASDRILSSVPYPVKRHILNTAGIMTHPEHQYDMVRLGIGLYGVSPLAEQCGELRPVATLKSTIISIKRWPAGTTVGYARRGVLTRPSVIATVPIGYADGLDRHLSRGATDFIVRGVKCPTVGNICMDQCMIDITDVPGAQVGDDVEIFGTHMPVERVAEILDTIPYELIASVSPRVKRIYFRE